MVQCSHNRGGDLLWRYMRNPFRRNPNNQTITELENYYGSSYNSGGARSGKAWAMALMSLVITLAVIALLFFAGRWAYRTLTDDSSDVTTTQGEVNSDDITSLGDGDDANNRGVIGGDVDPRSDDDTTVGVINPSDDSAASNNDENDSEGVVSDEAASTTRNVAGETTTDSTARNSSSDSSSDALPSTGPSDILIAIPLAAIVIGYMLSRRSQLR